MIYRTQNSGEQQEHDHSSHSDRLVLGCMQMIEAGDYDTDKRMQAAAKAFVNRALDEET